MISRKIDGIIANHFKTSQSALLLTGARQTGKTYAIRKYAETNKLNLIEINFLEDISAKKIFSSAKNAKDILLRLAVFITLVIPFHTDEKRFSSV